MDEQLAEQERFIYQTQKQLLTLLAEEARALKKMTTTYQMSDSCPMYESLHNLELSKEDVKALASMYSDGDINLEALETFLKEKVVRKVTDERREINERDKEIMRLRKLLKGLNRNASIRNDPSTIYPDNEKRISEEERFYREWSGNANIPKRWRHILARPESSISIGPPIYIPFKPPYWESVTQEEMEDYDEDI